MSVRNLATFGADISCLWFRLQQVSDVGLFSPDVRNLASPLLRRTPMKRLVLALVVACALSTPALAGDIPTSDAIPPPPPSSNRPAAEASTQADVSALSDSTDLDLFDSFILSIASLLVR